MPRTRAQWAEYGREFILAAQWVAVMIFAGWLFIKGPEAAFRLLWLDLESVTIADHEIGQDPQVEAWREIKADTSLYWSVTIREHGTAQYVAAYVMPYSINFKKAANSKNPLEMSLSDWIDVPGAFEALEAEPRYGPGTYYAVTCHHKFIWKRCVNSAPYVRRAKEANDADID